MCVKEALSTSAATTRPVPTSRSSMLSAGDAVLLVRRARAGPVVQRVCLVLHLQKKSKSFLSFTRHLCAPHLSFQVLAHIPKVRSTVEFLEWNFQVELPTVLYRSLCSAGSVLCHDCVAVVCTHTAPREATYGQTTNSGAAVVALLCNTGTARQ